MCEPRTWEAGAEGTGVECQHQLDSKSQPALVT